MAAYSNDSQMPESLTKYIRSSVPTQFPSEDATFAMPAGSSIDWETGLRQALIHQPDCKRSASGYQSPSNGSLLRTNLSNPDLSDDFSLRYQSVSCRVAELTKENEELHKMVEKILDLLNRQKDYVQEMKEDALMNKEHFKQKAKQCKDVITGLRRRNAQLVHDLEQQKQQHQLHSVDITSFVLPLTMTTIACQTDATVDATVQEQHRSLHDDNSSAQVADLKRQLKAKDVLCVQLQSQYQQQLSDLSAQHLQNSQDKLMMQAERDNLRKQLCCISAELQEREVQKERYSALQQKCVHLELALSQQNAAHQNCNEQHQKQREDNRAENDVIMQDFRQLCDDHHSMIQQNREKVDHLTAQLLSSKDELCEERKRVKKLQCDKDEQLKALSAELMQTRLTRDRLMQATDQWKHKATEKEEQFKTLECQMDVYKTDFEEERAARSRLHAENFDLKKERDLWLTQQQNYQRIANMQRRYAAPEAVREQPHLEEEGEADPSKGEFLCPICSRAYPDLETLEEHCADCE